MQLSVHHTIVTLVAAVAFAVFSGQAVAAPQQSALAHPAAQESIEIICQSDEPTVCEAGAFTVVGEVASGSVGFSAQLYPNPSVALISISNTLLGQPAEFVATQDQILGYLTESLFPGPGRFRINLPIAPTAATVDLDHDGEVDDGVQVYALAVVSNLIGDSYLQQIEQMSGLGSVIADVGTGDILYGTLLVFAGDDRQAFPAGYGADRRWFTDDDPTFTLPAGYTVVSLAEDGRVTLDRSPEGVINTVERAEQKSPSFSEQGILESFISLIDLLKQRYAYTDLRSIDWEAVRSNYLPVVETAAANQDIVAYYLALDELAIALNDSHVSATANSIPKANVARASKFVEAVGGGIGAYPIAVSEGEAPTTGPGDRILVLTVGDDTPAAAAGWAPGTEIVTIDGVPPAARYSGLPRLISAGTEERRRAQLTPLLLSFPVSQSVTIGYRLPDSREVLTATFVAGDYANGNMRALNAPSTPVTYRKIGSYAVVTWNDFVEALLTKIAVLEEALAAQVNDPSAGVILDLRGNGGGWVALYEVMASYFFNTDAPMPVHLFDFYAYVEAQGGHVATFSPDYRISAPRAELAYTGPLVILVDEACASACEYFTQHLQLLERATVIGQYATAGAGGTIERVAMPGGILFQFTQGKTTFAGTDVPNLEAKGVIPDVRVPVTLETELAKLRGEDPVLEAGIAVLDGLVAEEFTRANERLFGTTWRWTAQATQSGAMTTIDNPEAYTVTFGDDGTMAVQADCNRAAGSFTIGDDSTLSLTLGPASIALCPPESRSDEFLDLLGSVVAYQLDGDSLQIAAGSSTLVVLVFTPAD